MAATPTGWRKGLLWTARGSLEQVGANADMILTHDPRWKGVLGYDSFAESVVFRKEPPGDWLPKGPHLHRRWTDTDTTQLRTWFSRAEQLHLSSGELDPVVDVAARRHAYHPIKQALEAVKWDGKPRIDTWLIRLGGAEDTPLTRAVSSRFLISAVARVYEPGCQVDHVLVLEGPQGIGKTSLVRILTGDDYFLQDVPDDLGVEAQKALRGKWIAELGELDHWTRAKVTKVRGFVTRVKDSYRDSYGRRTRDYYRCIVFIGTVNPPYLYLVDDAGGRRWWPVRLRYVKRQQAAQERAQLWAEALIRYKAGEAYHLTEQSLRASAKAVQEDRFQKHPWEEAIGEWSRVHPRRAWQGVTLADCHQLLGIPCEKQTRDSATRIISILSRLGFQKIRAKVGGDRPRTWVLRVDKKLTKPRFDADVDPSYPVKPQRKLGSIKPSGQTS